MRASCHEKKKRPPEMPAAASFYRGELPRSSLARRCAIAVSPAAEWQPIFDRRTKRTFTCRRPHAVRSSGVRLDA
jgi:hypothetical protein